MRARLLLDAMVGDDGPPALRRFDLGPASSRGSRGQFAPVRDTAALSLRARVARVNRGLAEMGRTYHPSIPLDRIQALLEENGFDGASVEGVYMGRDGRANDPVLNADGTPTGRYLSISWHRMDVTGNWEIVAYVS